MYFLLGAVAIAGVAAAALLLGKQSANLPAEPQPQPSASAQTPTADPTTKPVEVVAQKTDPVNPAPPPSGTKKETPRPSTTLVMGSSPAPSQAATKPGCRIVDLKYPMGDHDDATIALLNNECTRTHQPEVSIDSYRAHCICP